MSTASLLVGNEGARRQVRTPRGGAAQRRASTHSHGSRSSVPASGSEEYGSVPSSPAERGVPAWPSALHRDASLRSRSGPHASGHPGGGAATTHGVQPLSSVRIVVSQEDGDQRFIPLYDTYRAAMQPPVGATTPRTTSTLVADPQPSFESLRSVTSGSSAAAPLPHPDELPLRSLLPMAHGSLPFKLDSVVTKVHWHAVPGAVQQMLITKLFQVAFWQPVATPSPSGGRRRGGRTPRALSPASSPNAAASGAGSWSGFSLQAPGYPRYGTPGGTSPSPMGSHGSSTLLGALPAPESDAPEVPMTKVESTTTFAVTLCITFNLDQRFTVPSTPRYGAAGPAQSGPLAAAAAGEPPHHARAMSVGVGQTLTSELGDRRSNPPTPSGSLTGRRGRISFEDTRSARDSNAFYLVDETRETGRQGEPHAAPLRRALGILQAHWAYVDDAAGSVMKAAEKALQYAVRKHTSAGKLVLLGRKVKLRQFDLQDAGCLADRERSLLAAFTSLLTPKWHVGLVGAPRLSQPRCARLGAGRTHHTTASARPFRTPTAGPRDAGPPGAATCLGCPSCAPLLVALMRHDLQFLSSVITTVLRFHTAWLTDLASACPRGLVPQVLEETPRNHTYCRVLVYGADGEAVKTLLALVSFYIRASGLAPLEGEGDGDRFRVASPTPSMHCARGGHGMATPTPPSYSEVLEEGISRTKSVNDAVLATSGTSSDDAPSTAPQVFYDWACVLCGVVTPAPYTDTDSAPAERTMPCPSVHCGRAVQKFTRLGDGRVFPTAPAPPTPERVAAVVAAAAAGCVVAAGVAGARVWAVPVGFSSMSHLQDFTRVESPMHGTVGLDSTLGEDQSCLRPDDCVAPTAESSYSYGAMIGEEGVTSLPFVLMGVERPALTYDDIDAFLDAPLPSWAPEASTQQCVVVDVARRATYYYDRSREATHTMTAHPAPLVSQALRDAIDCYNLGADPADCEQSLAIARAELAATAQCVLPILRDLSVADYKSIVEHVRMALPTAAVNDIPLLISICNAIDPAVSIPNLYPKFHFFS